MKMYLFPGFFQTKKPLKANKTMIEITLAYTVTGIFKSPKKGNKTESIPIK
ncbi:hypothetical protein D3C84_1112000 [compost metagenome]